MADEEQQRLDDLDDEIEAARRKAEDDGAIPDSDHRKHHFADPDAPVTDPQVEGEGTAPG